MRPPRDAVAQQIEQFLRERFGIPVGDGRFTRQAHLWQGGYVDSMGAVELISFLEERFATRLTEEVLFSPDFSNIDGMAGIVAELQGAQGGDREDVELSA